MASWPTDERRENAHEQAMMQMTLFLSVQKMQKLLENPPSSIPIDVLKTIRKTLRFTPHQRNLCGGGDAIRKNRHTGCSWLYI